jgi:hypothetical protein
MASLAAQIRSRGKSCLGFDSCGNFYIGGIFQVKTAYGFDDIEKLLTAVADGTNELDVYEGTNYPGQPWHCYRRSNETRNNKSLKDRLTDLLTVSTTPEELESIELWEGKKYCTHLRLREKSMERNEWLVKGRMHNGAHFPLCVFTNNSSSRSEEAQQRRNDKRKNNKGKGKGKSSYTAVAESTADSSGQRAREESQPSLAYSPPAVAENEQPWEWHGGNWSWYQSSWRE